MVEEVELKLELTPEAAAFLEASTLLEGDAAKATQRSIYFDTADTMLFRNGLSLRIRRSGRKRVQTVKADNAKGGGLFARPEWEMPVSNDAPVLDARTPIQSILGEHANSIAPVFEVNVVRRIWMIADANASIELVLDRGVVAVGDRQTPICEVELEMKSGQPSALFALARKIDAIAPARIGVFSKSERGYRLLAPPLSVFKAEPVELALGMSTQDAFYHIAHSCLRHYRLNEALLLERRVPDALHQARVAIRRLRSAFTIFRVLLDATSANHFRNELRWLAKTLGEARDLDVLVEKARPGALHDRLETARSLAYGNVEAALNSQRVRDLMLNLVEWLALGDWLVSIDTKELRAVPAERFAADSLDRLRRRLKKRGANLEKLEAEPRHEVRKAAKKLRYSAEFFVSLFPEKRQRRRYAKFLSDLQRLQRDLGASNDLVTGPEVIRGLGLEDNVEAGALTASGKMPKLLRAAAEAHADLIDVKKFWR
ncbi:inorganic triphosphatase [Sphingobium sp. SCG-1]|uniref:CYTH and CHAD domain-containing protein n=1 Tax=Sphingobium sp. SCG-1 TaxID=2072936 RepID=UPI000CD68690|nr:CHAD domain-containing protein [Sphingobium sp. SCG-1]AUW59735.1 inorganic triphosphatase [Sphingobium sp. SCG-1]